MAKVRIIINKSKRDTMGRCPLKIRVTHQGVRKEIYIPGVKIEPKNWDAKKQRVKNSTMLNVKIQNTVNQLNQEIYKCMAQETEIRPDAILEKITNGTPRTKANPLNAIQYCQVNFLNDPTLVYSTRKTYGSFINTLKEFDPNITLDKMDIKWVASFKEFLLKSKKLNLYTINTRIKHVKRICRHAYDHKVISKYPLEGLKITRATGNRQHLSIDQLRELESYCPSKPLVHTHKAFLFGCYTGLRFSDLATLSYKNISVHHKSSIPEYRLQYQMRKTGKILNVLLSQKALNLLNIDDIGKDRLVFELLKDSDLEKSSDKLAKKIESVNALANKRLKMICEEAGIKDKMSFHSARHTFFCIALELGVDLMSLKELGGHSDLKVTQEYLKVTDTRKNEAMLKFDKV